MLWVLSENINPEIISHADFQTNFLEEANSLHFYLSPLEEYISTYRPALHGIKTKTIRTSR